MFLVNMIHQACLMAVALVTKCILEIIVRHFSNACLVWDQRCISKVMPGRLSAIKVFNWPLRQLVKKTKYLSFDQTLILDRSGCWRRGQIAPESDLKT